MPEQIRCVLFDLDNTLIEIPHTYTYFDTIIQEVMALDFQLRIPNQQERDELWRTGDKYVEILNRWGVEEAQQFWTYFDQRDASQRRRLLDQNQLHLYSDVLPTLKRLHENSIALGIVTNTPEFIALPELNAFQLMPYFKGVIGLGDNQKKL